jgi:hypothetical protein
MSFPRTVYDWHRAVRLHYGMSFRKHIHLYGYVITVKLVILQPCDTEGCRSNLPLPVLCQVLEDRNANKCDHAFSNVSPW